MAYRRRTVLAALLASVAGCGSAETMTETNTATRSVSEGETATPEDPGRGTTAPNGVVTVVNGADEDRYVTVAVDRNGESVLVESRTVRRGTALTLDGRVPPEPTVSWSRRRRASATSSTGA
ncbi:hypothetical protein C2R22_18220 [Salinigranum rubrum]|uniref:Uncharacterized protein n=1 Tax=Salinigranum rubrum TaxID=755307 RepID=A0A2I8VN26_9EURY|nr:hypothetical protein [Salinigranum rubrum]AUV83340.1 hypothetical protein C2R22_18220 [Salinigranum rubrum]